MAAMMDGSHEQHARTAMHLVYQDHPPPISAASTRPSTHSSAWQPTFTLVAGKDMAACAELNAHFLCR